MRKDPRGYVMFKYLNATPRVTYLARIKNPNPKMPGADQVGMANGAGHHGDAHGADHGSHGAAHDTHNAQPPHGDTHAPAAH
jgi:molybdopterin-containing oxidoreductase family iron-sulfur binding subunit